MEQRILKGTTATLLSYPRVESGGAFLRKQPVSCTVRIGTPAVVMPDEDSGVAAVVDTLSSTTAAAANEGDDELTITQPAPGAVQSTSGTLDTVDAAVGSFCRANLAAGSYSFSGTARGDSTVQIDDPNGTPLTNNGTGDYLPVFSDDVDLLSLALNPSTTYRIAVAFDWLFTSNVVGGQTLHQVGTIAGVVVVDGAGNATISEQSVTYTTNAGNIDFGPGAAPSPKITVSGGNVVASVEYTATGVPGDLHPAIFMDDTTSITATPQIDYAAFRERTFTGTVDVGTDADLVVLTSPSTDDGTVGNDWQIDIVAFADGDLGFVVSGDAGAGAVAWTGSIAATPDAGSTPPTFTRGRRYLVGDDDVLDVQHAGADGASVLKLAESLLEDVAAGAAVLGWACSKALTAAQTDLVGNAFAIFTATFADGTTATWGDSFRIVRRLPGVSLTPTDLTQKWPAVRTMRTRADPSLEETIQAAWDDDIEDLLEKQGVDAEDVLADAGLQSVWALACLRRLVLTAPNVSDRVRDDVEKRWLQKSADLLGRKDWYDAPQDETPAARPPEPPTIRPGTRLRR